MSRAIAKETKPKLYLQRNQQPNGKKFTKQTKTIEKSRAQAKMQGPNPISKQNKQQKHQKLYKKTTTGGMSRVVAE